MREGKWTKGRWRAYPQSNGLPTVGNMRGLMVAQMVHPIHQKEQKETAIADANLIAAAPDLYEALWNMYSVMRPYMTDNAQLLVESEALRALAKARGEKG